MTFREHLVATLSEVGGKIRVRNALNPMLWLSLIVSVAYCGSLHLTKDTPLPLSIAFLLVITTTVISYGYLLITNPDRLQSEDYQLKKQTLELIENKGSKKAIDASIVQAMSQKDFLALPFSQEEEDEKK